MKKKARFDKRAIPICNTAKPLTNPALGSYCWYMAINERDRNSSNPRLQCSACGQWKRLYTVSYKNGHKAVGDYLFYGGCSWNSGNDHLAGDKSDVCAKCYDIECKRIGAQLGIQPL